MKDGTAIIFNFGARDLQHTLFLLELAETRFLRSVLHNIVSEARRIVLPKLTRFRRLSYKYTLDVEL